MPDPLHYAGPNPPKPRKRIFFITTFFLCLFLALLAYGQWSDPEADNGVGVVCVCGLPVILVLLALYRWTYKPRDYDPLL